MKKIVIALIALLLVGCTTEKEIDNKIEDLSIVVPSGAPSLGFYSEISNDKFATADAQSILPELKGENGSDIIVIDTVSGIKALNAGANYKLAANITFGNFYIGATGNDDNKQMDEGDYIVLFSQGATPDLVFHYIYGDKYDSNIHYVSAVSDASACLIKGINIADDEMAADAEAYVDYVMIAEPAITAAMLQNENVYKYANIQEEYYKHTDHNLVQASVFVSNKLSNKQIETYLEKLKNDISSLIDNPDIFDDATKKLADEEIKEIFGIPNAKIAKKVLMENGVGLGYKNAYENKENIDKYLSIFDMEETNEEIYFK